MKTQSGFALIPLIVILTLAGLGLYWYLSRSSPTPNPLAGWQTYRNEEYGFEVKYPNNFSYDNSAGGIIAFDKKEIFENGGCNQGFGSPFCGITLELFSKSSNIEAAVRDIPLSPEVLLSESKSRILGGNKFIVVKRFYRQEPSQFQMFYFIESSQSIFEFFVQSNYEKTADQILSTFKFVK